MVHERLMTQEEIDSVLNDLMWPHIAAEVDREIEGLVTKCRNGMKGEPTPDEIIRTLLATQRLSLSQRLQLVRRSLLTTIDKVIY